MPPDELLPDELLPKPLPELLGPLLKLRPALLEPDEKPLLPLLLGGGVNERTGDELPELLGGVKLVLGVEGVNERAVDELPRPEEPLVEGLKLGVLDTGGLNVVVGPPVVGPPVVGPPVVGPVLSLL